MANPVIDDQVRGEALFTWSLHIKHRERLDGPCTDALQSVSCRTSKPPPCTWSPGGTGFDNRGVGLRSLNTEVAAVHVSCRRGGFEAQEVV